MGPIIVIGAGAIAVLWFLGLLTPRRLKWLGAATAALVGLRVLAMGQTLAGGALIALGGWLAWTTQRAARPAVPDRIAEARALLGVGVGADEAAINAAYRARIADLHPDRGGSDAAAGNINAARDILLEYARRRRG
jgi:hypothetical protein